MAEATAYYYNVTDTILNNITNESLNDFIRRINKMYEYTHSGQNYSTFFSDLLNRKELTIENFNDYLFDELFFGQQRSSYIKKITSLGINVQSKKAIVDTVTKTYPNINSDYYNQIATTFFSVGGLRTSLVAFELVKNDKNVIIKIKLLYAEEIEIYNSNRRQFENSYIPIEIDLENNYLITKVYPKSMVKYEEQKPEALAIKYMDMVTALFDLQLTTFSPDSRKTLYNMSKDLFIQIYNKMIVNKPKDIEQNITLITEQLANSINVKNIDKKLKFNKFFDLRHNITILIENILICDTLYDTLHEHDYSGIDGFLVYLKFSDGKNVNARLKGENCDDTIATSETFLALRAPIDNAKSITILQIKWIINGKPLRIKYEATSPQFLHIHFYRNLTKGDFYYGLKKYEEFESKNLKSIQGLDSISSHNMA